MDEESPSYFELFKDSPDKVSFAAGAVIFEQGQPGTTMYVVNGGQVELRVGERLLEVVEKGGILGELALVDKSPRSATAIAKSACELVTIERDAFKRLVKQMPYFALKVMEVMAQRLRRQTRETA